MESILMLSKKNIKSQKNDKFKLIIREILSITKT